MGKAKGYNSKEVTNHLRLLAAEAHDISIEDGSIITKGQALAKLIWDKALGYTEKKKDDEGVETEIFHEPASWAIQMVYDRMEGKTSQAITEDEHRVTAAEKVRGLALARFNDSARKTADPVVVKKGPPKFKGK